jgi:hypothetical protein
MNASKKSDLPKRSLKPIVIALALALPSSAALAASMNDVVETRADQNVDQQYGRDSVYAFSADEKPLSPEDTSGASRIDQSAEVDTSWSESPNYNGNLGEQMSYESNFDSTTLDLPYHVGSGYTGSEQMDSAGNERIDVDGVAIVPLEIELIPGAIALNDGTDKEYERGYYDDPDVEPISPNNVWTEDEMSALSEDQSESAGIE